MCGLRGQGHFPDADKMTYGPSDFDHRHRWVLSYVWEPPNLPTTNPVLQTLLHGWQWTGIGQYQSGGPLVVRSGRDNSRTAIGRDRAKLTGVNPDPLAGADKTVVQPGRLCGE